MVSIGWSTRWPHETRQVGLRRFRLHLTAVREIDGHYGTTAWFIGRTTDAGFVTLRWGGGERREGTVYETDRWFGGEAEKRRFAEWRINATPRRCGAS